MKLTKREKELLKERHEVEVMIGIFKFVIECGEGTKEKEDCLKSVEKRKIKIDKELQGID